MLSIISEHTELPNISPISFFESSGSNSEDLLLNANFANIPRNNYGRPVLAVPPVQAERLTRQIPTRPEANNDPSTNVQVNGPIRSIPITPLAIPHEIPQPNYVHPYNKRGILQAPMIDQYNIPGVQSRLPNLTTQGTGHYPYDISAGILPPNERSNVAYYYNASGQLYLDTQGSHSNLDATSGRAARSINAAQQQRNPSRRQLNPPVMPHVQGNCHWCGRTYDEVALDAVAAYTAATDYHGETVRDRNISSRAHLDGFEAALICFKNAVLSQPRACVGSVVQR